MQKIKTSIIKSLLDHGKKMTNTEYNLLLYLSHYQSDDGSVIGIYYKNVCREIQISYQSFYNALYGLKEKGLIEIKKESYTDWDVLIRNNDLSNIDYTKKTSGNSGKEKSYLNTGVDLFYSQRFYALKVNEKKLIIELIRLAGIRGGCYKVESKKFYEDFKNIFGVKKRALQNYLTTVRRFFEVKLCDGYYCFIPHKDAREKTTAPSDKDVFADGVATAAFRRSKAVYNEETYRDTRFLIIQYFGHYKRHLDILRRSFLQAVDDSIRQKNSRELRPSYIHKLLIETFKQFSVM